MSVVYVCDGCGRQEPGTWVYGHEEYEEEQRCLAGCGESFKRLKFTENEWARPLVEAGQSGGGGYWWTREDKDGQQHACSRACIDKVAANQDVTRAVMPW